MYQNIITAIISPIKKINVYCSVGVPPFNSVITEGPINLAGFNATLSVGVPIAMTRTHVKKIIKILFFLFIFSPP